MASSVTLYGVLDEGVTFANNVGGGRQFSLDSGTLQQSRFGFTGQEDLGGGYSTFFRLEQGYNMSNGAMASSGLMFSREARVALNAPWGQISLGRQAAPTVDALAPYSASMMLYGPSYFSTHPGDLDRTLNIPIDSSVKYVSPSFHGLTAEGMYAFGGVAGSLRTNSARSASLSYNNGPLSLGAAWLRQFGTNLTNGALLSTAANPFGSTSATDGVQTFGFGGSWQFPGVLVHGVATQTRFDQSGAQARSYELGARYNATPFLTLGADYNYTQVRQRAHMNIATLSSDYALSKRTDLYAVAAYEWVAGRNSAGSKLAAQIFTLSASDSAQQLAIHVGVRHRF